MMQHFKSAKLYVDGVEYSVRDVTVTTRFDGDGVLCTRPAAPSRTQSLDLTPEEQQLVRELAALPYPESSDE